MCPDFPTIGGASVVSYFGVHQTSPINVQNGATGNSASASVTLTSVVANCWAFQQVNADGNFTITGWNYTQRCVGQTGGAPATRNAVGSQDTNGGVSGNVTMAATLSGTTNWATSAFAFAEAVGPVETVVAKDFPIAHLEVPVKAKQLTSKVQGATKTAVSKDFPEEFLKSGKAKELRSKWT